MPGPTDFAVAVTVASVGPQLITRKVRVAGRIQDYDSMKGLVLLRDGETEDEILVDISLCFSPFKTYPWLQERNTVVVAIGYIEEYDEQHSDMNGSPPLILRAILLKDRSELDLKLWNQAIACDHTRPSPHCSLSDGKNASVASH